jgi:hypothetical protein
MHSDCLSLREGGSIGGGPEMTSASVHADRQIPAAQRSFSRIRAGKADYRMP